MKSGYCGPRLQATYPPSAYSSEMFPGNCSRRMKAAARSGNQDDSPAPNLQSALKTTYVRLETKSAIYSSATPQKTSVTRMAIASGTRTSVRVVFPVSAVELLLLLTTKSLLHQEWS